MVLHRPEAWFARLYPRNVVNVDRVDVTNAVYGATLLSCPLGLTVFKKWIVESKIHSSRRFTSKPDAVR